MNGTTTNGTDGSTEGPATRRAARERGQRMATGYAWDGAPAQPQTSSGHPQEPRVTPLWWRDAVAALTWASVLVTVALWVSHQGLQVLNDGLGAALTSLGRLTGFLSADLLLVQVLLMARIPAVERSYGQDRLARWHRWVGFASFDLLLVHMLFITLGYAGRRTNPVKQFVDLVLNYPGMLLAFASFCLFVLVVVTSIRKARRRLRYESWHLLHLYAYLGVGLAVPHEIWTGTDLESSPIARLYWWSLWIAAAGSVLVWRVAVPLIRSLRHDLRVEAVVPEGPDAVSVYVTGRDLDRLHAQGGQFFTWRFLGSPGWTRGNPWSLSASPQPGRLRITVKDLGEGSRRLFSLRPGSRVLVEGPYGRLHAGTRTRPRVTLMASGIGITPMRAMLEELRCRPGDLTLIYRASSQDDLLLRDEIDQLAAATGTRVFYVVGRRVPGRDTWLPEVAAHLGDAQALLQLVPDIADQDVYLCGAAGWMDAVRAAALEAGVPAGQIHLERFSW